MRNDKSVEPLLYIGLDATPYSACSTQSKPSADVIDIVNRSRVLCLFKILYHKYIFLDVNSIFDLVQVLLCEGLYSHHNGAWKAICGGGELSARGIYLEEEEDEDDDDDEEEDDDEEDDDELKQSSPERKQEVQIKQEQIKREEQRKQEQRKRVERERYFMFFAISLVFIFISYYWKNI